MSRPGRLGVGVVGAGRVGVVLGNALRAVGHDVVGVSGVSTASIERAEAMLPGVPLLDVEDVVARAEVVLLTVPDDALAGLVSGLAGVGAWRPGQIVVHTAGRFGIDVLEPARSAGAIPIAIHPAMTFTGTSLDLARLVGCPFAVTAPPAVLPVAQALVLEIGGEPVALPEESRELYHAALSHGANHLVTLTAQAERVLEAAGVEEAGHLLTPLLTAALDGALRGGEVGLTGPVVRGDVGTVRVHLAALADVAARDERLVDVPAAYAALARATVQRSLALGRLRESQAQELLDALGRPGGAPARPARAGQGGMAVARNRSELAATLAGLTGRRAVVMTMGALHEGHLELVRQARRLGDHVVVTIFVNPLQFGAGEDLDRYPRSLDNDLAALAGIGVDLVFAPTAGVVYPDGDPLVRVSAGALGEVWEGAARPGHFDGVLTVVLKLMNLLRPDVALFGQKDAQQLTLIRRMVRDLDLPVEVVSVPIQRDADGLALSSRNAYLTPAERTSALVLSRALRAAQPAADAASDGARATAALSAAKAVLEAAGTTSSGAGSSGAGSSGAGERAGRRGAGKAEAGAVVVDYITLIDTESLEPVEPDYRGTALLAVAARVGATRLIDNTLVYLGAGPGADPGS